VVSSSAFPPPLPPFSEGVVLTSSLGGGVWCVVVLFLLQAAMQGTIMHNANKRMKTFAMFFIVSPSLFFIFNNNY
jgi:hypothetical protein